MRFSRVFVLLVPLFCLNACVKDDPVVEEILPEDPIPYLYDKVFDNFTITYDVVYGIDDEMHKCNIVQATNDPRENRPLLIILGGGAFFGSNLAQLEPLAKEIASYGVVVVLARYRSGPAEPGLEYMQMLIKGQQDSKACVRYFRDNAGDYKLDPDLIFNGGYGTGGYLALLHAYLQEDEVDPNAGSLIDNLGGWEGEQGSPGVSSQVAGVLNLAGGMYETLDPIDEQDVGIVAVHGTDDTASPYDTDVTPNGGTAYGSLPITMKADSVGIPNFLFTIEGGDHDSPKNTYEDYAPVVLEMIREIIF